MRREVCEMRHFLEIADQFQLQGRAVDAQPHGGGHINDTFLVKTDTGSQYILQRINTGIFKDVDALMNNILLVTDFLKKKIAGAGGDPERETLSVVPVKDGSALCRDGDDCWRVYPFIERAVTLQTCENQEQFEASAGAFGHFQKLLADFPAETLQETIPNFHNTKSRYRDFEAAVAGDVCGRAAGVQEEIAFVRARKDFASVLMDMQERGELPLRVTHNDTKLNNVLNSTAKISSGTPGTLVQLAGVKGTGTEKNNSIYDQLKSLDDKIAALKRTYEAEKTRYWNQFNTMEQMISNMNTQSSYLAQMMGGF